MLQNSLTSETFSFLYMLYLQKAFCKVFLAALSNPSASRCHWFIVPTRPSLSQTLPQEVVKP